MSKTYCGVAGNEVGDDANSDVVKATEQPVLPLPHSVSQTLPENACITVKYG